MRTNLPAIQLYPGANSVLLDQPQKFTQHRFLNGLARKQRIVNIYCKMANWDLGYYDPIDTDLIGDANDVANKLPNRIFKALNTGYQVCLFNKSIFMGKRFQTEAPPAIFWFRLSESSLSQISFV